MGKKSCKRKQTCVNAAYAVCKGEVTFESNPFAAEIYDDHTPMWMCEECRYQAAMDI